MYPTLQIFDTLFSQDELNNEFQSFFYKYNLTSLFTNEHRAGNIRVTYVDAKSVVNSSGAYHRQLKELSDILNVASDNLMYEEAVFKIIYNAETFQKMMNNVKKVIQEFKTTLPEHQFNFWNVVFYTKGLLT